LVLPVDVGEHEIAGEAMAYAGFTFTAQYQLVRAAAVAGIIDEEAM
jgi:hypothetical protein